MIRAIRSNKQSFKTVNFDKGLNIILADKTKNSSDKDSRNGLGKSTLIEIIHFCLGSSFVGVEGIRSKELEGWTFILDLTLSGKDFVASRNTSDPSKIWVEGDFSGWFIQPELDKKENKYFLKVRDWCQILGFLMFGLTGAITEQRYSPTFRSLMSYFGRRGVEGFSSPFKHFNQQQEWDKQVNNAYLLNLNWEYASQFQVIKDKEKILQNLRSASDEGLLANFIGSIGTLEAEKIGLNEEIKELNQQINKFKVHPQYYDVQKKADEFTKDIHRLINERTIDFAMLKSYQESIREEEDTPLSEVLEVYKEAGLLFPQATKKKIDKIINFHSQVVKNRQTYLKSEIEKISKELLKQEVAIEEISNKRADLLGLLKTHGALDEYSKLQENLNRLEQKRESIGMKIENLKKFEEGIEQLDIERKELLQKARQDKEERKKIIETAIKLFNQNSKALYNEPGALSIDINQNGYKFGVEIKRAASQGIGYMKVFCYDLMFLQFRSSLNLNTPGFLIHDSTIFDGVDERQIAKALELAAKEAEVNNFQYICTLNSDMVPSTEFNTAFSRKFNNAIKLKLTDASEDGGLLGVRF